MTSGPGYRKKGAQEDSSTDYRGAQFCWLQRSAILLTTEKRNSTDYRGAQFYWLHRSAILLTTEERNSTDYRGAQFHWLQRSTILLTTEEHVSTDYRGARFYWLQRSAILLTTEERHSTDYRGAQFYWLQRSAILLTTEEHDSTDYRGAQFYWLQKHQRRRQSIQHFCILTRFFPISKASRQAVGPIQPPIQYVLWFFLGGGSGRDVISIAYLHLVARLKINGAILPRPPYAPSRRALIRKKRCLFLFNSSLLWWKKIPSLLLRGGDFLQPSRPALGPTQPPVQCVPGLSWGGGWSGWGMALNTHRHLSPKLTL